jgi:hypothetical protein
MAGLRKSGARFAPAIRRKPKPHTVPSTLKSTRCLLSGAKKKASLVRDGHRRAETQSVAKLKRLDHDLDHGPGGCARLKGRAEGTASASTPLLAQDNQE